MEPAQRPAMKKYQIYAKNFILTHPYCGLFLRMGLGKTRTVLEALYELNPTEHVLIIAPKTIARCSWINEIKKWNMPFRMKSLIVNEQGKQLSKKKRDAMYADIPNEPPTIYFINNELISGITKAFPDSKWPFRTIIIDESQCFKSPSAQRVKALFSIRPWVSRIVLMSGSPAPNGVIDLWAQIRLLDFGERLGRTITSFRNTYFRPGLIVNNYPVSWIPLPGAEDTIYRKINDLVISMKNTVLPLPPLSIEPVHGILSGEEAQIYRDMMKHGVIKQNGKIIEAANAAVLQSRLSQMASGSLYIDDKHNYVVIHKCKLELCEYVINNVEDNVLIAYFFQNEKEMLLDYLKKAGMDPVVFDGSPEMERNWNQKKYRVMLLQPGSSARGLNLQDGGSTLIWYTLPWSLEQYEQTITRLHRQGQTNPVTVFVLMIDHTIDKKIFDALTQKDINQSRLIDALQVAIDDLPDTDADAIA